MTKAIWTILLVLTVRCSYTCAFERDAVAQPSDADFKSLGGEAKKLLQQSKYEDAQLLVRQMNQLNSQFRSKIVRGDSYISDGPANVAFGEQQLQKMLADRPAMSEHIVIDDQLWDWCRRRFAGIEGCGPMIWDPRSPDGLSEQVPATSAGPGTIRINEKSSDKSRKLAQSDELWSRAAFELMNCRYGSYFEDAVAQARLGVIDKDEYVKRVFIAEMSAIDDTREFYAEVYLKWAETAGSPTTPRHWFIADWWGDKNELFKSCTDQNAYPWVPYGQWYDSVEEGREMLKLRREPVLVD